MIDKNFEVQLGMNEYLGQKPCVLWVPMPMWMLAAASAVAAAVTFGAAAGTAATGAAAAATVPSNGRPSHPDGFCIVAPFCFLVISFWNIDRAS